MCFSPEASFTVSGTVALSGAYLVYHKKLPERGQFLAAIPFIFSFHQFTEGLVWLGHTGTLTPYIFKAAEYIYTFIANSFWPIYIPLSLYFFEREPRRKRLIGGLFALGLLLGIYLFYGYTFYSDLVSQVDCSQEGCSSLSYAYDVPYFSGPYGAFVYFGIIILPIFITHHKRFRYIIAPTITASFILAQFMTSVEHFPSVWCFFAAVVSLLFLIVFWKKPERS